MQTTSPKRVQTTHALLVVVLMAVLYAPFLHKPVHIDDANFLMLAEGAAQDWWRPHAILINWSGSTEPAFDILANPPGIAWYLLPVRQAPEWVMHLWMLPWFCLGTWGCFQLAKRFTTIDPFWSTVFVMTCPVLVIATQALTPDLPAFACLAAGVGGYLMPSRRPWMFALLAGCAVLFRYSGGLAIPFLLFVAYRTHGWKALPAASCVALPVILLALHDLHAYGEIHLLTMFQDQNDSKPVLRVLGNVVAGLAMLGGVTLLPVVIWRSETLLGAVIGAIIGWSMAYAQSVSSEVMLNTMLWTACGAAALTLAATTKSKDSILSTWAIGGALFFFVVKFAAARYWALFLPGIALLGVRNVQHNLRWLQFGIVLNVGMSLLCAIDDQQHARANRDAAYRIAEYGIGQFSGHWGWQHYLMQQGWTPLERGETVSGLYALGDAATQQLPTPSQPLIVVDHMIMPDTWWGPRLHAPYAGASYHAAGFDRFAPWTFSDEPYDEIILLKPRGDR